MITSQTGKKPTTYQPVLRFQSPHSLTDCIALLDELDEDSFSEVDQENDKIPYPLWKITLQRHETTKNPHILTYYLHKKLYYRLQKHRKKDQPIAKPSMQLSEQTIFLKVRLEEINPTTVKVAGYGAFERDNTMGLFAFGLISVILVPILLCAAISESSVSSLLWLYLSITFLYQLSREWSIYQENKTQLEKFADEIRTKLGASSYNYFQS